MRVKRFGRNLLGRDIVCGDIHGCYDQVWQGMKAIGFDMRRDRLFSVGDTVDRGPGSPRAAAFLAQPYVHAIRGNHEDMFLEIYSQGEPDESVLRAMTRHNGMAWFLDLDQAQRATMIASFAALPIAIEIETARGTVGLVHAQVPKGMDWDAFKARIEAGDAAVTHEALWGRDRIESGDDSGVRGVGRVFCGHTPIHGPLQAGNVYYLDTGAVFGVINGLDGRRGRLTMAAIEAGTAILKAPSEADGLTDVRQGGTTQSPFGRYAR